MACQAVHRARDRPDVVTGGAAVTQLDEALSWFVWSLNPSRQFCQDPFSLFLRPLDQRMLWISIDRISDNPQARFTDLPHCKHHQAETFVTSKRFCRLIFVFKKIHRGAGAIP